MHKLATSGRAASVRVLALVIMVSAPACSRSRSQHTGRADAGARLGASAAPATSTRESLPAPPLQAGAMAPRLRAVTDGLLMTWIEPSRSAEPDAGGAKGHRVRFAQLVDGHWSKASTISEGSAVVANWADAPSVVRASDGALVAHWAETSGSKAHAYDVLLARSTDGGSHWKRLGRAHDDGTQSEHGFVSLLAEAGGVRAFWLDGRETASADAHAGHGSGAMTLRTAVVRGDELSDGELLDARVCNCCGTSAVTTRRGPLLAYRDRRDGEIRDIALLGRAGRGWSKPRLVHADGWSVPGCPVNGPALAADGDRLAVAWYTYVDQRARVRLALSRDAGATLSDPIEVDSPSGRRAPIGRVDVVLDGDGAVVSWLASEREDALLLAARVAADGRVGDPLTVARISASRESGFPQLERLGDELVLAWTEAGKPSRVAMRQLRVNDLPAPRARRSAADSTSTVLAVGSEVPDYRARLLDGSSVSLSSLRGEVVLLNLWATWCEPCRQEVDELSKLHARYAARGVRIVAVSVDGAQRADEVRSFVERRKLPYTIWRDPEDHASSAFGVATLPANFVIDRSGTVRWSQAGALTADDEQLARALDVALKRTP